MGGGQSAPKKVTFERKDGDAIEVTQEAFDLMTGKKRTEVHGENKENQPAKRSKQDSNYNALFVTDESIHAELAAVEQRFQEKLRKLEAAQKRDLANEKTAIESMLHDLEEKLSHSVVAIDGTCRTHQDAVLSCYKANPNKTLNCSKLVEQFSQCVNAERLRLLGATVSK